MPNCGQGQNGRAREGLLYLSIIQQSLPARLHTHCCEDEQMRLQRPAAIASPMCELRDSIYLREGLAREIRMRAISGMQLPQNSRLAEWLRLWHACTCDRIAARVD